VCPQGAGEGIQVYTYLLTLLSRVLLEKLTGSQLAKKFTAYYGNRKFITAFTSARQVQGYSIHIPQCGVQNNKADAAA